ncbi:odorant receptor coreceptor-like [Schistocerca americana]|uniref:odorant receptor coreceptor-like n=1 Tax=Schistocerca americana TaxID=7009 RepID=UPI001F50353B|nr:odorant receptor coreceptor-like [Schistocerca americana]
MQQDQTTLADVEATLQPYVGGLRLLGQWSLPGGGRRLATLCAVLLAHGLLITTSCLNLLMDPPRDLQVLTVNAHSTLTIRGLAVKVVSFSLDGARLRKLLQLLGEARAAFPDSAARRRRYGDIGFRLYIFLQVSHVVCYISWGVAPLLSSAVAPATNGSSYENRGLPVAAWLPGVDVRASPTYEVVYGLQLLFTTLTTQSTVFLDSTLLALMLHLTAELEVLNDNMAAVQVSAEVAINSYRHGNDGDTKTSKMNRQIKTSGDGSTEEQMYEKIVENLLQETMDPVETIKLLTGFSLFAYQTALFCLVGQRIIDQSERLVHSAFSCGWPDGDGRCKQLLLVFCLRSCRAASLKVGLLYPLSKDMVIQVLHTSYTLFNFLYHTERARASLD